MPKPKSVNGRRMVRHLLRKGWWVARIHGSHHVLHHDDRPDITIARNSRQPHNVATSHRCYTEGRLD
jgi:predicted RNA binding protein YcfA (HicA-like mRNA interferase family)